MKKTVFTTTLICFALIGKAQNSTSKVKLHAATLGFGGFHVQKNGVENGGAVFIADVTFSVDKNLISTSYLTGSEIAILDNSTFKFDEFSLLYGRELTVAKWFRLEGFAGVGYYHQQTDYNDPEGEGEVPGGSSASFPLRINTKFYFTKKFGMGFNTNYSINSVTNNFSTNLIFHYRFN